MQGFTRTLIALGLLLTASTSAADPVSFDQLLSMDLAELTRIPVLTASRHEQQLWQAPAIVSVLDGDSLRHQGYRSVAEALTQLPGFFMVNDGVGQYAVVRGIGSGLRAYGRTLKVMIDGQPIGLRSNADPFLGVELIPMAAIDRIEVVRGPSSALYGADAYLGVINIITVRDGKPLQTQLDLGDTAHGGPSAGASVQATGSWNGWQGMISAGLAREDRSGLALPASSPRHEDFATSTSQDDISKPTSLYARASNTRDELTHSVALHVSERNSRGEFLDFGTLSHDNQLVERQQTLWWQGHWQADKDQDYQMRLAYAWGGNTPDEHLSLGQDANEPARDFGYEAGELAIESQRRLNRTHIVAGFDSSWDHEDPYTVFSIDRTTGNKVQLSPEADLQLFRNLGVYLQAQYRLMEDNDWELALNARNDQHNLYGNHSSYRIGITGSLGASLQFKLLHGSAFKAPNAFQLYSQPLFAGDALGNADLSVERAETTEAQLLWQATDDVLASVTLYRMEVDDLIELQPLGINTRWDNRGRQEGYGVETELRWRLVNHDLGLTTSWHDTQVTQETPLLPKQEVATASAPRLMATADWRYPLHPLQLGSMIRYVSERRASEDNIEANLREPYSLDAYTLLRLYATYSRESHRLTTALDNALDKEYAEPGYGGIDLPGKRRTLWLNWAWSY